MYLRSTVRVLIGCALAFALYAPAFAQCNSCQAAAPTCPTYQVAPAPVCPAPVCPAPVCPAPVAVCPAPVYSTPPTCPAVCTNLDIMQVLAQNPQASKFVAALQCSGVAQVLTGPGPFTVFAPTDAAFCKVPVCITNGWADDPKTMTAAMLYHITYGRLMARDISHLDTLGTLQGSYVYTWGRHDGRKISINNDTTRCVDVQACNGVIHYISKVLEPPLCAQAPACKNSCTGDLISTLSADPQYSRILGLIQTAGLTTILAQTTPITFIAPTDTALCALPAGFLDQLSCNPDKLRQYLLYAMVPGAYNVCQMRGMCPFNSFLGCTISPLCIGATVKLNNCSRIICTDILAGCNIIQAADNMLAPPCA